MFSIYIKKKILKRHNKLKRIIPLKNNKNHKIYQNKSFTLSTKTIILNTLSNYSKKLRNQTLNS